MNYSLTSQSSPTISMQWTHNPDNWLNELTDLGSVPNSIYRSRSGEGWEFVIEKGVSQTPRCAALYPDVDNEVGNCGAPHGHEYPHVWCWKTYYVSSMTRKSGVIVHA